MINGEKKVPDQFSDEYALYRICQLIASVDRKACSKVQKRANYETIQEFCNPINFERFKTLVNSNYLFVRVALPWFLAKCLRGVGFVVDPYSSFYEMDNVTYKRINGRFENWGR